MSETIYLRYVKRDGTVVYREHTVWNKALFIALRREEIKHDGYPCNVQEIRKAEYIKGLNHEYE